MLPPPARFHRQSAPGETETAVAPSDAIADRWADLHACAAEVAEHAGLGDEPVDAGPVGFPRQLEKILQSRRDLALQGLGDIDAMLAHGLTALRAHPGRSGDTLAPAQALWREFQCARDSVIALAEPED